MDLRWAKFDGASATLTKDPSSCDAPSAGEVVAVQCGQRVGYEVSFFNNVLVMSRKPGLLRTGETCPAGSLPVGLARQGRRGLFKVAVDPLVMFNQRSMEIVLTSDGKWQTSNLNEDGTTCYGALTVTPSRSAGHDFTRDPPFVPDGDVVEPSADCRAADSKRWFPVSREGSECALLDSATSNADACESLCVFVRRILLASARQ